MEVIDKDSGIVVASGASDVSENYFSIFACSNVEAGNRSLEKENKKYAVGNYKQNRTCANKR